MLYQGIELNKRESDVILFLESGSNNFWEAYPVYNNKIKAKPLLGIMIGFNYTIKRLHDKGLFLHISFVQKHRVHNSGPYKYYWQNYDLSKIL